MAPNGGNPRLTTAGASVVFRRTPPPREIPTAPNIVNLTEENQSLLNSFRSSAALTPQETNTCMQRLFNLMTSNEEDGGAAQFNEMVSRLDVEGSDLRRMAMLLTSDLDRFMEMARNKNGSYRIQELLGITNNADFFFVNAILTRFLHVMTDYEASNVGTQGMRVFNQEKKKMMYDYVLLHALHLACDRGGYAVLKRIIDDWSAWLDLSIYREHLLFIVAQNARQLSYHAYGNYVVQHVIQLNDLRCTHNVSVSLSGHFVYLSFTKLGSYLVQKLLDTEEGAVMVVGELQLCDGESLARLAMSDYGNYVVLKALRVMRERNRMALFWGLANKLMPYVQLLRGRNIGAFLSWL